MVRNFFPSAAVALFLAPGCAITPEMDNRRAQAIDAACGAVLGLESAALDAAARCTRRALRVWCAAPPGSLQRSLARGLVLAYTGDPVIAAFVSVSRDASCVMLGDQIDLRKEQ